LSPEEDRLDRLAFEIWFDGKTDDPVEYKAKIWDKLRDAGKLYNDMERSMDAARVALAFFAKEPTVVACACRAKRKGSLRIVG